MMQSRKPVLDNTYEPRRALDIICDMFGIDDMDVRRIEIVATLHAAPIIKLYHVGMREGSSEARCEIKKYQLVPKVLADESQNGGS